MSKSTSFHPTNASDSSVKTITPKKLGLVTNYAVTEDTADVVVLSNKTTPIDGEEKITIRSKRFPKVDTTLNIQYPSPVKSAMQYQVMIEAVATTTDSNDASFRVDEPVVMQLTVRHPRSGNINASLIDTLFVRLISTIYEEDGTSRWDDLMRSAERPVVD